MNPIEFKMTAGPFGDETSNYDVIIRKPNMTVRDLCEYVLTLTQEWGSIHIMGLRRYEWSLEDCIMPIYEFEYKWGRLISDNIPEEIKNKPIKRCTANGGWSAMDYNLYDLI